MAAVERHSYLRRSSAIGFARDSPSFSQPVEETAHNAAIVDSQGKRQCLQLFFQPCAEHCLSTSPFRSTTRHKALEPLQTAIDSAMAPGEAGQFELVHKLDDQRSVFIRPVRS